MVSVSKEKHRDVIRNIPYENIVIETDSPSQCVETLLNEESLDFNEGKAINKPLYLKYVLKALSEIRNIEIEELSLKISENFYRMFPERQNF